MRLPTMLLPAFAPYAKEYQEAKHATIRTRVRLFCTFSVFLYIGVSILSVLLDPGAFRHAELYTWAFLIIVAVVTLMVNQRTRTLLQAKLNALAFSFSIVVALMTVVFIYPEYTAQSYSLFAVSLFFISFVVPWDYMDVITIGLLHIVAFNLLYNFAGVAAYDALGSTSFMRTAYLDGMIFLAVALIIVTILRKRDEEREKANFVLLRELEKKNAQMERELALAREVHKTLIPKSMATAAIEVAVSYVPMLAVGGDYATFHTTKEGNLFFLIGDITGHGVPAALLVNRIYGEVENLASANPEPGALLRDLDKFVQEHFRETQMYLSVCSGLVDFKRKQLFYSNYGHPPQILHQRHRNTIYRMESQTHLLGIETAGAEKVFEGSIAFDNRDRIILFTDGLTETRGEGDELYGMERLEAFIKERSGDGPTVFNAALMDALERFRKGPVIDDTFLVTIDIK